MRAPGPWRDEPDCPWQEASTHAGEEHRHYFRYLNGHYLSLVRAAKGYWYWGVNCAMRGREWELEVAKVLCEMKARGDQCAVQKRRTAASH